MRAETRHAEMRRQQRAISPFVVSLLRDYGVGMRHDGAEVRFFDKASRRRVRSELGIRIYAAIEPQLDAYAVLSAEGTLITTAWRLKRLKRP
jgi:hypothetical protein